MKKIIVLSFLSLVVLSGCTLSDNKFIKMVEELGTYEYLDATLKGNLLIDIPETLVANQVEQELLKKAESISYHINQKSTPKVTYVEGDISLSGSEFEFKSYNDEKESLMYNGTGWYHFNEKPLPVDIDVKTLQKFLHKSLSDPNGYKIEKSKPTINFNGKEFKTTSYEIIFNDKALERIGKELLVDFNSLQIRFFTYKNKPIVIQYQTDLVKKTSYEENIEISLDGQLLFNSINQPNTVAPKPSINKVYQTKEDFLIELLLKN